jgi:DNA (cytosine-5)-methyltransferase 1
MRAFYGVLMVKPRLLDLCCGAGGAAKGYADAGFEVIGVDIQEQPRYPFTFIQGDALTIPLDDFDAYHASPLCQRFSLASYFHGVHNNYPDLIDPIRKRLQATGKPYIIENVVGAPLENTVVLCGATFGLRVYRHRLFESNMLLLAPPHQRHRVMAARPGAIAQSDEYWSVGGHFGHKHEAQQSMGIDWMETQKEIAQAIPPAYTAWLGYQLLSYVEHLAA